MQNFSDLMQEKHFYIWGWMEGRRKNVRFSTENWPYLGKVEDKTKVTINQ